MVERARKRLRKRAKKGFRGYPVATVAIYGSISARQIAHLKALLAPYPAEGMVC